MGNEMGNRNVNGIQASEEDRTEDLKAATIASNDADGLKGALQGLEKNYFKDSEAMTILSDEGGTKCMSDELGTHQQASESEQCNIVKDTAMDDSLKAFSHMTDVENVANQVENVEGLEKNDFEDLLDKNSSEAMIIFSDEGGTKGVSNELGEHLQDSTEDETEDPRAASIALSHADGLKGSLQGSEKYDVKDSAGNKSSDDLIILSDEGGAELVHDKLGKPLQASEQCDIVEDTAMADSSKSLSVMADVESVTNQVENIIASTEDETEDHRAASIALNHADVLKDALQGSEKNDVKDSTGNKSSDDLVILSDEGGAEVVGNELGEHLQEQRDVVEDTAMADTLKALSRMTDVETVTNQAESVQVSVDDVDGVKLVADYLKESLQSSQQDAAAKMSMKSSIKPDKVDDTIQNPSLENLLFCTDDLAEQDMNTAQDVSSATDENLNQEQATETRDSTVAEEEETSALLPDNQFQEEETKSVISVDKHESTNSKGCESTVVDEDIRESIGSDDTLAIDAHDDDLENALVVGMAEYVNPESSLNSKSQMEEDLSMEEIESCEDMTLDDKSRDQRCPDSEVDGNDLSFSVESASSAYLDAIDFEIQRLLIEDDQNSNGKLQNLSPTIQEALEKLTMDNLEVDDLDIQLEEDKEQGMDDELDDTVLEQSIQTEVTEVIEAEHKEHEVGNPSLTYEECNKDMDKEMKKMAESLHIEDEHNMESARDDSGNEVNILEAHDTNGEMMSELQEMELETDGPPRRTAALISDLEEILIHQRHASCSLGEVEQKHTAVESEIVGIVKELINATNEGTFPLLNASTSIIDKGQNFEDGTTQSFPNSTMQSQNKQQQCDLVLKHAAVNVSIGDACEAESSNIVITEPSPETPQTVKPITLLNQTTMAESFFSAFESFYLEEQEKSPPKIVESEASVEKSMQDPYANHLKHAESDSSVLEISAPETDKTQEVSSNIGVETTLPFLELSNEESEKSPLLHQKQLKVSQPERSKPRAPLLSLMKEEVYAVDSQEKEGFLLKKSVEEGWRSPEKKFMAPSPRTREKQKPKSSLFSSCMCCTTAVIN